MKLDEVKKLHQKKYRNQFGYYLVEGEHLVLELLKAGSSQVDLSDVTLYVTEEKLAWAEQQLGAFSTTVLNQKQMAQISDTKTPQGLIACVPLPVTEADVKGSPAERCIYLHEVQDPGNLGTILRTLAWFGNFRLLLSANSVDPFNPKVVRASMGAIFHLPVELDVSLDALSQRFDRFAYLDLQGSPIADAAFSEYQCYLFGIEARGVPRDALDKFNAAPFTIPGNGSIESLNLASSVSICGYRLS